MHITDLLREIIAQSSLTQTALAQRLNVSHPTLNSWLHGRSTPRRRAIERIEQLAFELLGTGDGVTQSLLQTTVAQASQATLSIETLRGDPQLLSTMAVLMTYHTNSIEGSTLTLADNEKILVQHQTLRTHSAREQLEARNHQAALLWLIDCIADDNFHYNEQLVQDLHVRLMNGLASDAGEYRRHGVRIMGSRVTVANHARITDIMACLFHHTPPHSFADMAASHATFEQIHPFSDGNGRVGRLLLAGLALEQGVAPPIIRRESRAAYYAYLETAQMHDKPEPLTYLLARESIATHHQLHASSTA